MNRALLSYSVYFAHDKSILKMDSHGQNQQLVANGSSVSGLDYHYAKNSLFWIDVKTKKVGGIKNKNGFQTIRGPKSL